MLVRSAVCRLTKMTVMRVTIPFIAVAALMLSPARLMACAAPSLSSASLFLVWNNGTASCTSDTCPVAEPVSLEVGGFGVDLSCPEFSYHWDFGDGDTAITSIQTASHLYAAPGLYHVTVTIVGPFNQVTVARTLGVSAGVPALSSYVLFAFAASVVMLGLKRL